MKKQPADGRTRDTHEIEQIRSLTRRAAELERGLRDAIAQLERENRMLRSENENLRIRSVPMPPMPPGSYRDRRAKAMRPSDDFGLPKWKRRRKSAALVASSIAHA